MAGDYYFKLASNNDASLEEYLGQSEHSANLVVTLALFTDANLSLVEGTGISASYGPAYGAAIAEVVVTCKDENDALKTEGGDLIFLHVEQLCYITDNYRCDLSSQQDSVPELPKMIQMTDNNDGTYSAEYDVPQEGTVTSTVVLIRQGGLSAEFFNNAFLDGVPAMKRVENFLDYTWGEDLITMEAGDFVSIHWYGKLKAPVTEDVTFILTGDDGFRFYFDNQLVIDRWDSCCDEMRIRLALVEDTFYDFVLEYREFQETAAFKVEWISASLKRQVIPPQYLYYSQRIPNEAGDTAFAVEVNPGETIPGRSIILEWETEYIAGKLYSMRMLSRDNYLNTLDNIDDNYEIRFSGPDGGSSGTFYKTAAYQGAGEYLAQFIPQIAGSYIVNVELLGGQVVNSPFTAIVYPGEIKPPFCTSTITGPEIAALEAGLTYFFTIQAVDIYGTLHYASVPDMEIEIIAVYDHHSTWPSPIAVPDATAWESIYGTDIAGIAIDNSDGSYAGQITIYRAGEFSILIRINSIDIMDSPYSPLLVEPTNIYAPYCVPKGIETVMIAGTQYDF